MSSTAELPCIYTVYILMYLFFCSYCLFPYLFFITFLTSLRGTCNLLWANSDASHFTYICKWDHQSEDWRLLSCFFLFFFKAVAWSTQSVEMLQSASQHTDRKRQFVVYEHNPSTVLFYLWLYGLKKGDICLWRILMFCVYGRTGIVKINSVSFTIFKK